MDYSQIVRDLIHGQKEIDRMKAEVNAVIRQILGFINIQDIPEDWGEYHKESFGSQGCTWNIWWDKGRKKIFVFREVDTSRDGRFSCSYISISDDLFNPFPFQLGVVQQVYEGLPVFIKGMLSLFPFLAEKWEPLLKAARK